MGGLAKFVGVQAEIQMSTSLEPHSAVSAKDSDERKCFPIGDLPGHQPCVEEVGQG